MAVRAAAVTMNAILTRYRYWVALAGAFIMAFLSAHFLFGGSATNVIPWGILALACGLLAQTKRDAWKLGAVYGFALSFLFLWLDNTSHKSLKQFFELLALIPLPSLFGALCGAILSRLAFGLRKARQSLSSKK